MNGVTTHIYTTYHICNRLLFSAFATSRPKLRMVHRRNLNFRKIRIFLVKFEFSSVLGKIEFFPSIYLSYRFIHIRQNWNEDWGWWNFLMRKIRIFLGKIDYKSNLNFDYKSNLYAQYLSCSLFRQILINVQKIGYRFLQQRTT